MGTYEYQLVNLNDDLYLDAIMDKLGQYLEITIEHMELEPEAAARAFVNSGLARLFETQSVSFVAGKSGSELAAWAFDHCGRTDLAEAVPFWATVGLSVPYWAGEMIAYLQMRRGIPYRCIFKSIPYTRMTELYHAYGENNPDEMIPILERVIAEHPWQSELKQRRKAWGMTQAELAERANVSLRAIQQYEQGTKDIRRASVDSVYRLSLVLRCTIEDLIH